MILLYLPIAIYVLFILWVSFHWVKSSSVISRPRLPQTKVSVLIPIKNETSHLPQLLLDLKSQNYPQDLCEFILIDDHSSDHPEGLLRTQPEFVLLKNAGEGKKAALTTGIKKAKGELIVMLDADCTVSLDWLSAIVNYYENSQAALLICPVKIAPVATLWQKVQALEFQSLAASTAGAALAKHPMMCNGANLAFRRSLFHPDENIFKEEYVSGDDMFLLEYAKRKHARIAYVKSLDAMASTAAVSWTPFWRQRFRWTSKSGGYRDGEVIVSGIVVLLANLSLLVLPFVSPQLMLVAMLAKLLVDFILLKVSASFFEQQKLLWLVFIMTPIYPFYVLISAVGGVFSKPWK